MSRKILTLLLVLILLLCFSLPITKSYRTENTNDKLDLSEFSTSTDTPSMNSFPNTFSVFVKNKGQLKNDHILFYSQEGGIWFTDDGVWLCIKEKNEFNDDSADGIRNTRVVLKQTFVGSNRVIPIGFEPVDWYSNYFFGNDASGWQTNVPSYKEVHYKNLYNGIDLKYYMQNGDLKYDITVHPGAEIENIRIKYEGADSLHLADPVTLLVKTGLGDLIDGRLYIYQEYGSLKKPVDGRFVINDDEYSFDIPGSYDPKKNLVIDPEVRLEYCTYMGGTNNDYGDAIAADGSGCAYITGATQSPDFPTTAGANDTTFNKANDVYVFKLDSTGSTLLFSTFLGGLMSENGESIRVDSEGNVYVAGKTNSDGFPVSAGAYQTVKNSGEEAFFLKLSPNGSKLEYSSFLGGNSHEEAYGIAVDSSGHVIIAGDTSSNNFPTTSNAYSQTNKGYGDCFITKINLSSSELIFSTFVGGTAGDDLIDMDIDSSGNVYAAVKTSSDDFPTSANAFDDSYDNGFDLVMFKLDKDGKNLAYSTYVGGSDSDFVNGIVVDSLGYASISGYTYSSNFPTTNGAYDEDFNGMTDIFVFKLNITGDKPIFSTFIGTGVYDKGYDIGTDTVGNIYISGETSHPSYPVTSDAYSTTPFGWIDIVLSKFDSNGANLIYSTFIGGTSGDYGEHLAVDPYGNVYITGYTNSNNLPTESGVVNSSYIGKDDIFVLKFSFQPVLRITSISLFEKTEPATTIYSNHNSYTFSVELVDTKSFDDVNSVNLNLDPDGINIKIQWVHGTNKFNEISDPQDCIILEPSSSASHVFNLWKIDFDILFKWNYPDEDYHDVKAYATSYSLAPSWLNTSEFYRIENDLVFNGTLTVHNEAGGVVNNNSLVRGGEKLRFTGLVPVYEGTANVYPPKGEYNISIKDQLGSENNLSPEPGVPIDINFTLPNSSYPVFEFNFSIEDIPDECDKTNTSFAVIIDADRVVFSDFVPMANTWQTSTEVIAGVTVTDYGGALVNATSLLYSISINNGTSWVDWGYVTGIEDAMRIEAKHNIIFSEGRNNLIKWRASDTVGNGPVETGPRRILVDTEEVSFNYAYPSFVEESETEEVQVGITIFDKISGVNASSIECSYTVDRGKTWSAWASVSGFKNGPEVNVYVNITFANGTDNMVKWRAKDIAGNGPTESLRYSISVDIWKPTKNPVVFLIFPENGSIMPKSTVRLSWLPEDISLKGITYDLYFDTTNPPDLYISDISNTNYNISGLSGSSTYYWKVIPRKGDLTGTCKSGIWNFKIDLPPDIPETVYKILLTGPERIILKQGENKSVKISITNLGTEEDIIELSLQPGVLSNYITLTDFSVARLNSNESEERLLIFDIDETLQPGEYNVIVTARSVISYTEIKDTHEIAVEILPEEKSDADQNESGQLANSYLFLMIILVIAIIIAGMLIFVRRKKKIESKAHGVIVTKPSTVALPSTPSAQMPIDIQAQHFPGMQPPVPDIPFPVTAPPAVPVTPTAPPVPVPVPIEEIQKPQLPPFSPETPAASHPAGADSQELSGEHRESGDAVFDTKENAKITAMFDFEIAGVTKPVQPDADDDTEKQNNEPVGSGPD